MFSVFERTEQTDVLPFLFISYLLLLVIIPLSSSVTLRVSFFFFSSLRLQPSHPRCRENRSVDSTSWMKMGFTMRQAFLRWSVDYASGWVGESCGGDRRMKRKRNKARTRRKERKRRRTTDRGGSSWRSPSESRFREFH